MSKHLKILSRLDDCIVVFEDDSVYTVKDNEVREFDSSRAAKSFFIIEDKEE
tara:strand:- start:1927 stop:2082 length:156 start_codon:yes stop_codon:yes gene_type:complete